MSDNCIECVVEKRTGGDLLCDGCRAAHGNTIRPVVRPRCQAAASILNGVIVDHDKGLYPTYCILEEGHSGRHQSRKSWWPNAPREGRAVARTLDADVGQGD